MVAALRRTAVFLPRGLLAAALLLAAVGPAPAASPKRVAFRAGAYDPLLEPVPVPDRLRAAAPSGDATSIFLIQLDATVDDRLRAAIARLGGRLLDYLPRDAFAVRLPAADAAKAAALPGVRFLGPLHPGLKIAPDLGRRPFADPDRRSGPAMSVIVQLFEGGPPLGSMARVVEATGASVLGVDGPPLRRLRVLATRDEVEAIATIDEVAFIEEAGEVILRNDTTRWVIQSNLLGVVSVWNHGLHGEGQVVGIVDDPLDMSSCYFLDPGGADIGPDHRKVVGYRSSTGPGAALHGTHVSGTAAGDATPVTGATTGNGMAYAARISFENVGDIAGSGGAPSNLYQALESAYLDGARVHTNSWGDDGSTGYTSWCVDIDRFSHDHEDSLVLFAETNTSTLRTPENAKNLVAVGASRNGVHAGEHCSGGLGPTEDGRLKPDLYAPGCSILSASVLADCSTTSLSGTSMASPAVAGGAALVRQYFVDGFYPTGTARPEDALLPSGALLKAVLLNGAVNMDAYGGGPPPNVKEGWGRLLLEDALYFDGDVRRLAVLADRRNAEGLATGGSAEFVVGVNEGTEPLRVTLVFTDPPGSLLAGDPVVNDLDLEVESPGGVLYLGNRIDAASGESVPGGAPDARNNVEQVFLDSPAPGGFTVRVRGRAVNQGPQGFALLATGDVTPVTGPLLVHTDHLVDDAPPLGNGDGLLDPGETAALPVQLGNSGSADAIGVSASLGSDREGWVKITRPVATFPDIVRGEAAWSDVPRHRVTVQPDATCGDDVRFSLDAQASSSENESSFLVGIGQDTESYPGNSLPFGKRGTYAATLDVGRAFTIADAQVTVDITHADVGQLVVTLTSPAGTMVTLHDRSGAGTADLHATFDSGRAPDGPGTMDDFDGEASDGTWTLTVDDVVGGKIAAGRLDGWSLRLEATEAFTCHPLTCPDPLPGDVGSTLRVAESGTDLGLTWQAATGAVGYRVWKSPQPTMEGAVLAEETPDTAFGETGALDDLRTFFYLVRGINGCN